MLTQEAGAWLTYSVLFGLISFALLIKSIQQWHIIPFMLYGVCIASGSLSVILTPSLLQPNNSAWRNQEPIVNQLPVYSILIFAGIIHSHFSHVRFVGSTINNHRRWASLHPVNILEKDSSSVVSVNFDLDFTYSHFVSTAKPSFLFSRWIAWIYIVISLIYAAVILAFVICKVLIVDSNINAFSSAILITLMTFPVILHTLTAIYSVSKCHSVLISGIMKQNKQNTILYLLKPVLFTIAMSGTTAIAWLAFAGPTSFENVMLSWILVKSITVYLPLLLLLLCCMFNQVKEITDKNMEEAFPTNKILIRANKYKIKYNIP